MNDHDRPVNERELAAGRLGADRAFAALEACGAQPQRFLWRTDAEGRFVDVTPLLSKVVGPKYSDLAGRAFEEVSRTLQLDPRGRLAEALTLRKSWSGVEVDWPMENARVPVVLGALPVFGEANRFCGFRGYGVLHVDRVKAAPVAAAPGQSDAPLDRPAESVAVLDFSSGKVVPLRPFHSAQRVAETTSVAAALAPNETRVKRGDDALTPTEQTAFDEIARALGAVSDQRAAKGSAPDLMGAAGQATERADERTPQAGEQDADALWRHAPAMLDQLPVGILVARGMNILFANRTLLDCLGYADVDALRSDEGLARLFFGRPPKDFAARTQTGAVEVQAQDGESLDVDAHLQTIDWDGAAATLIALRRVRAPTARPDAPRLETLQRELSRARHETDELRAILDTTADAIATIREGRIEQVNRPLADLFGADPAAFIGKTIYSLVAETDRGAVADYLRRALAESATNTAQGDGLRTSVKTRQGTFIETCLTIRRIGAPQEQTFCATLRDLTASRRSDGDHEARREAERANAAKSDFLAKVSHEIRTPLNAIIGFAEVMMEERFGPLGAQRYKDYLKDIYASGTHVLSLVNDLLDLSKIEAGKMELEFQPIDANAVITECVSIMQAQASGARVIVRLSLAPRLPCILADGRSLRQILLNLLSNAVKFNEAGGQVIVSSALTDTGFVVIRVKDTGIGMSASDVETALEPFRQVATLRKVSGTGLGLPVTKALIQANRAFFSINSRKNEGTLVEVAFPPPQVLAAE